MIDFFRSFASFIVHIFIPNICEISECHSKKWKKLPVCRRCYRQLANLYVNIYRRPHRGEKFYLERVYWNYYMPLFYFADPIQELIHQLKYHYFFIYAKFLVFMGIKRFAEIDFFSQFEMIIPVPIHPAKKRLRGYNQALVIAKQISQVLNIKYSSHGLKRLRHSSSQTLLSATQRQKNMEQTFQLGDLKNLQGKKVILVDDVVTTGATANACCKILKQAGADKIFVLSLARAVRMNLTH